MSFQQMISPSTCALALIDFQPAMFQGVQSHDRKTIVDNVQILARTSKLFEVPTIISTVAKDSFSGPFTPEVTEGIVPRLDDFRLPSGG
jgi:nicotinamidase-related amidase